MNDIILYLGIFFVVINITAFLLMWVDKGKAGKKNSQRISEGMMFFMATMFGSVGVYAGMFTFRHKTRKWYFITGIPFLIIQNMALLYLLYLFLNTNFFS